MHVRLITFNPRPVQTPIIKTEQDECQSIKNCFRLADSSQQEDESNKKKLEYNKYSDEQIVELINLLIEGVSVKAAAEKIGITVNSAYRYRKMWNEGGVTPIRNKRGPTEGTMSKLKEEHAKFIVKFIDNEPNAVGLSQIKDAINKEFPELQVSNSALHRHMKAKCCLSLKRTQKPIDHHNDQVEYFAAAIESWMAQSKEIDFEKNCIFVGEASYTQYFSYNSNSSTSEIIGRPKNTQHNAITILGAISTKGVIDVSLRKTTVTGVKRRADGTEVQVQKDEYILNYLTNLMDVLVNHGISGFYLIMDDSLLQDPSNVKNVVEQRGFKSAFSTRNAFSIPNPIEQFWSKTLEGIDRRPFGSNDQLSMRIMESCNKITSADCSVWINQAATSLLQQ